MTNEPGRRGSGVHRATCDFRSLSISDSCSSVAWLARRLASHYGLVIVTLQIVLDTEQDIWMSPGKVAEALGVTRQRVLQLDGLLAPEFRVTPAGRRFRRYRRSVVELAIEGREALRAQRDAMRCGR